ncbi:MAG: cell filamentation protein Fic [Alphaproteobacteria bacterium]|nr:cell filamentation protein Fic [Alphaproteobacteria bacterium]
MNKKQTQFLIYSDSKGEVKTNVRVENENIWLTQKQIAELFETDYSNILKHIKNIYNDEELAESTTMAKFATVVNRGFRGEVEEDIEHYNLDVIIAVGYRVNSKKATAFRIWATNTLKEYMIKGFVLDDARLKNGKTLFGKDYFQELLERIRSIRASERRIYQKITDIFAECSVDYNPKSKITINFYAHVQDKFHFAIHENTASELIYKKADSSKPNMNLKTWKNAPNGRILKSDVKIGKNYLNEVQIKELERTISSFFDYIERMVEKGNLFNMEDFANSVDKFLNFNEYRVLPDFGSISRNEANKKAELEYDEFNKYQKIESDFDKQVKKLIEIKNEE